MNNAVKLVNLSPQLTDIKIMHLQQLLFHPGVIMYLLRGVQRTDFDQSCLLHPYAEL